MSPDKSKPMRAAREYRAAEPPRFNWRAAYGLFRKELLRFSKVWFQTVLAPLVTALLYLLVFSHVMSGRPPVYPGVDYAAFIIPGLMMMSILQNAFANSSSSLIQSKVTGNIVFVLLSPLSHWEFFAAMTAASVVRGVAVGSAIYLFAIFYVHLPVAHPLTLLLFTLLGAASLGALGIIGGIWADKFDQIAAFQNFIIMPLTFLSGVFYSIHSLPLFWQLLSHFNPFFYMIDGFRYGFFGHSDVPVLRSVLIASVFSLLLAAIALILLRRGYKLRH